MIEWHHSFTEPEALNSLCSLNTSDGVRPFLVDWRCMHPWMTDKQNAIDCIWPSDKCSVVSCSLEGRTSLNCIYSGPCLSLSHRDAESAVLVHSQFLTYESLTSSESSDRTSHPLIKRHCNFQRSQGFQCHTRSTTYWYEWLCPSQVGNSNFQGFCSDELGYRYDRSLSCLSCGLTN